jgi:hypothetical protein
MRRAPISLLIFSLVCAAPRAASADDPPPPETADSLYNQGNEAYDRGDFALAFELYSGAFKLRKSYDVARNLGVTELKLGKYKLAVQHLSYSLSLYPSNRADTKKQVVEWLEQAKAEVGSVHILLDPESAACKLNGAALSREEQGGDIVVDPGDVEVECGGVAGHRTGKSTASVKKGERVEVSVKLERAASVQGPKGPGPVSTSGHMRRTVLWMSGAIVSVASIGVGVTTGILSIAKAGEADGMLADLREKTGRKAPCAAPAAPGCEGLLALRREQDALGNTAFWTLITGGVMAAATTFYGTVTQPPAGPAPLKKAAVLPVIAPGAGALVISGSW